MRRRVFRITPAMLLCLALVFATGCARNSGDDDDHTPNVSDNDDNSDDNDDDNDSSPSDDDNNDSSPDDDDNDDDNDDESPEAWCLNLGDLPPDPGWAWQHKTVTEVASPPDHEMDAAVALTSDGVYVLSTVMTDYSWITNHYLTHGVGDTWEQWELLPGVGEPQAGVFGLAVDAQDRPWSVLFDYDHSVAPTVWSLARWENGQPVEILPEFDDGLVGFVDLYPVTADGHFVYAYDYGALTLVAQYPDGRFHRRWALSPLTEAFAATSDGWLHGVFVGDGSAVRYQRGSPWIPFITKDLGPAPFAMGGNFGQAPPGFDSSGVLYFTSGLADGNLWLGAYDGKGLSFQRWFDRPFAYLEIDPFFGFGVDAADRPYLVLDRNVYQGTETVCLVFREGVSNRVEVVATGSFAMLLDWEASPDGRMAAVYDHYVVGTSASIESYVRTENLY